MRIDMGQGPESAAVGEDEEERKKIPASDPTRLPWRPIRHSFWWLSAE